jgi:hypothetical protein
VELRDHPLMTHLGTHSWPPVWTGAKRVIERSELGMLIQVTRRDETQNRCFLLMKYQNELYMGCLMVDDRSFAKQVFRLLQSYIGYSIKEIGDIDLSHTL